MVECGQNGRVNAQDLFPASLLEIYETFSQALLELGDDIDEQFTKTQVAYRVARQFAWLSPINKTTALITLDLWEEHDAPLLSNVIRFRDDKVTHQMEARTAGDVTAVIDLGWFPEAVSWGRKQQPS
jgi:predicted transport protein